MAKEQEEGTSSGQDNIRRVYALPSEMVERITKFQQEKGLASEVEAVRKLLDEALKSRDDLETIVNRLLAKLGQTRIASDAARDILAGHPLVTSISFHEDSVVFELKKGDGARIYENGAVQLVGTEKAWYPTDKGNPYRGGSAKIPTADLDDEIPF